MKLRNLLFNVLLIFSMSLLTSSTVYSLLGSPEIIQSYGVIEYEPSLAGARVILRHYRYEGISSSDPEGWVDDIVTAHPYANIISLCDVDPLGVISYTGWDENKWWVYKYDTSGAKSSAFRTPYSNLKRAIDRFHYHGWKVLLESTFLAWVSDETLYNYIRYSHPELTFVNARDQRMGLPRSEGGSEHSSLIPNPWAKWATADTELNIQAGDRFIDLYTNRLTQMIQDGSFVWDGWFGTDGWNGFPIWYYSWYYPSDTWRYASFAENDINDWLNLAPSWGIEVPTLPSTWDTMNTTEKASWVGSNARGSWYYFWKARWAKLYAQIRNAIRTVNPEALGAIIQADEACVWDGLGGIHDPMAMWSVPDFQKEGSFDFYYPLTERARWGDPIQREEALTVALIKSKDPSTLLCVGLQLYQGTQKTNWINKQIYLVDVSVHVWYDQQLYRAVDPNITMAQYAYGWDLTKARELFSWIRQMHKLFSQDLTPIWLGPIYTIPETGYAHDDSANWIFNYDLVYGQYVDEKNLNANPNWTLPTVPPCPVTTNNSMIDKKIFETEDGRTIISMINMENGGSGDSVSIKIDMTGLNFGNVSDYQVYWQSDLQSVSVSEWYSVSTTLRGGADVLVISPSVLG